MTMPFSIPLIFFFFSHPKFQDFIPILYFVLTHTATSKNLNHRPSQPFSLTTHPNTKTTTASCPASLFF